MPPGQGRRNRKNSVERRRREDHYPDVVVPAIPGRIEPDLLILASGSPRRRDLLSPLGIPLLVDVSHESEAIDSTLDATAQAVSLAKRKARAVAARWDTGLVLAADTIVELDGEPLGKPGDDADACRMLGALRGRAHEVVTGVAVVDAGSKEERSSFVSTTVIFRMLSNEEIARYIVTGEPRDKAGAYAIQGLGAKLIAEFDGCFTNVVGLPLCETTKLLTQAGCRVPVASPVCILPGGAPCPRLV